MISTALEGLAAEATGSTESTGADELPDTGGPSTALLAGLISAVLLLAGGGLLAARRAR